MGLAAERIGQPAAILAAAGVMLGAATALAVLMPHLRRQT